MDGTIIFKISAIGIVTAVISMILKKAGKEDIATLVSIAGLIFSLLLLSDMLLGFYETLKSLFEI